MASLMDIDDPLPVPPNKGKATVPKTTPWVEKFRPQSLADVAAHRDIIDTSMLLILLPFLYNFRFCFTGAFRRTLDMLTIKLCVFLTGEFR